MTKERPILFSGAMVRAILDGRKTQTRRVMSERHRYHFIEASGDLALCPYGQPGDRLWVREAIRLVPDQEPDDGTGRVLSVYNADGALTMADAWPWKRSYLPPMHCPRGLSRIDLEVTGARVERLNDCSDADAVAEGIAPELDGWTDYSNPSCQMCQNPVDSYRTLWDSINGAGAWEANPWVWVVEFRRAAP